MGRGGGQTGGNVCRHMDKAQDQGLGCLESMLLFFLGHSSLIFYKKKT